MNETMRKALLRSIRDIDKNLQLNNHSPLPAQNHARRKEVNGSRFAYFKPRFERQVDKRGKFNGYKFARKMTGASEILDAHDGNVSWTVLNPNTLTLNVKQSKIAKYLHLRRAIIASLKVDAIVFEYGLSAKDKRDRKYELKQIKYGKGKFTQSAKRHIHFDVNRSIK